MQAKLVKNVKKDNLNKIKVRIVTYSKKNSVFFMEGENLENKNYDLQYIKGDVAFVQKNNNGQLQIKEYHTYDNLIKHLDSLNKEDKNKINKSLLINKFTNIFNLKDSYLSNSNENEMLSCIKENNKLIRKSLNNRFTWINNSLETNSKLIIGFGNHSVFETGITLHHTYGIPYIPGSALKGVLKNYIIEEYFKGMDNCKEECEKNANEDKLFIKIFGGKNDKNESVQGNIIFMDSFPNNKFNIKREFMTSHHKDYYGYNDKEDKSIPLPLDYDGTNPIQFLVVEGMEYKDNKQKLKFEINIGLDNTINNKIIGENEAISTNNRILKKYKGKSVREFILENLIDALNFHGIGAKTSVGYGYFDIDKENFMKNDREEINENRIKEEKKQEELKFKEKTKNMSEFETKLYKINIIKDEKVKNQSLMQFYNENIDTLDKQEQKLFAEYFKSYLESMKKWKYKSPKKNKLDKNSERVKKICEILNIELP
ncbi:type III-B CRISPR module RAMP protein Cmr6 [Clostridium amazonitimonense]|uniref:type III-B CRISPR module RAMP protein Cmr6 n=1 Tax=Clostridium amazonitimonense TaxID=1499689 RepID=UPI000509BC2B|nr:type III-B CRISPR module RAMP protein Cmr6 [Clostridium amazonitimonense]